MWPCHVPCRLRLIVGHLGDFIPRRVSSPEASREGRAGMEKGISPIAVSADGPCAHRSTHSAVTSPGRSQQTQPEGIIGRLELPGCGDTPWSGRKGAPTMPQSHRPYPPAFRRQMIKLVRRGRTPEELWRQRSARHDKEKREANGVG